MMWEKRCRAGWAQMTIRRMRIEYWIPQFTNTPSQYMILLFRCNKCYTNAPLCYPTRPLLTSIEYRALRVLQ